MRLFPLLATIFYLVAPLSAQAVSVSPQTDQSANSELQELVDTLENDQSREEFVDQLKTLIDAKEDTQSEKVSGFSSVVALSETLGV